MGNETYLSGGCDLTGKLLYEKLDKKKKKKKTENDDMMSPKILIRI